MFEARAWDPAAGFPGEGLLVAIRVDEAPDAIMLSGSGRCLRAAGGFSTVPVASWQVPSPLPSRGACRWHHGPPQLLPDGRPNPFAPQLAPQVTATDATLTRPGAGRAQSPCEATPGSVTASQL